MKSLHDALRGQQAERRVGGGKGEAVATGLDVEDCAVARGSVLALAPAGRIEPAQEITPLALDLFLRSPARDERCAVARPCDSRKIAITHIARLCLAERRHGLRVKDGN